MYLEWRRRLQYIGVPPVTVQSLHTSMAILFCDITYHKKTDIVHLATMNANWFINLPYNTATVS